MSERRVVLIPTGKCEYGALAGSLSRCFPEICFEVAPKDAPWDGFTSSRLRERPVLGGKLKTNLEKLAAELIAAVAPGERGKPADLAILVDDLELENVDQPQRAVEHVRLAVKAHLENHPWRSRDSQEKAKERARTRCSFHLLVPMVEAYFFAEAGALQRAEAKRPALLAADMDWEHFRSADAVYLDRPQEKRTDAHGRDRPFVRWATGSREQRERHPKHYLQFLCDPEPIGTPGPSFYQETRGGAAALRALDWRAVLRRPQHGRFARALLMDLADGLGVDCPFRGEVAEETGILRHGVLRNL